MLTKTSNKLLRTFTAHITEQFTLRELAKKHAMNVSLVHRSLQPLLEKEIVKQDKHKRLSLNYKNHHHLLLQAEYARTQQWFQKHKDLALLSQDIIKKLREDFFTLLVFGSAVNTTTPRDIDILLITNTDQEQEKIIETIGRLHDLEIDIQVITTTSAYEMLAKREEKNLMNEILNKHILLFGAESFYRIISKART